MGGTHTPPNYPIYESAPFTMGAAPENFNQGGSWQQPVTGGGALAFGAPGQDLTQVSQPSPGGKNVAAPPNQLPSGTQGTNAPNFDPALGMNAFYAPWNQQPGTFTSGATPDFGAVQAPQNVPLMSGFGLSPYFLGNYTNVYGSQQSPFGISPYWQSPFVSAAQTGGKGIA